MTTPQSDAEKLAAQKAKDDAAAADAAKTSTKKSSKKPETQEELDAEMAEFHEKRQAELDAADDDEIEDRTEYSTGFNNPPAVRATDGGTIGTKEQPVLKVAAKLEPAAQAEKNAVEKRAKEARKAARDAAAKTKMKA